MPDTHDLKQGTFVLTHSEASVCGWLTHTDIAEPRTKRRKSALPAAARTHREKGGAGARSHLRGHLSSE